jgi:hypothetical protein
MCFLFKTLTQFCNFTISLIGTSQTTKSVVQINNVKRITSNLQQNKIFSARLENNTLCFKDLKPDTNYKIRIQKNKSMFDRAVRTTEGSKCNINTNSINFFYAVPGAIRNLTITDIRDSSVRLKWQSPENFNGQFVKYVVTYQVLIKKVGIIN